MNRGKFTSKQISDLENSGIDLDTAMACGLESEMDQNRLFDILGWKGSTKIGPSLLFPYYEMGNNRNEPSLIRIKPDAPFTGSGEKMKYLQPKGASTKIYFPAIVDQNALMDNKISLFVTEGEKKAIKMVKEGYTCLAAPGVWNFHDPHSSKEKRRLKSCFDSIPLEDRRVYILFDAHEFLKKQVLTAKIALAEMLLKAGAKPYLLHLSDDERVMRSSQDIGIDDYLCRYGKEDFAAPGLKSQRLAL